MRYLQGIKNYMLAYKRFDDLAITGYLDSDFTSYLNDYKSTSGYIFTMVGGVMSWKSVNQSLTVTSSMANPG